MLTAYPLQASWSGAGNVSQTISASEELAELDTLRMIVLRCPTKSRHEPFGTRSIKINKFALPKVLPGVLKTISVNMRGYCVHKFGQGRDGKPVLNSFRGGFPEQVRGVFLNLLVAAPQHIRFIGLFLRETA